MCKIKKINTQNLIIFTYEIFKKMLSVNYEIKTTFYRMTRTPQMLYCCYFVIYNLFTISLFLIKEATLL